MRQFLFTSLACLPWLVAEAEPPADPDGKSPAPLSLIVELTDGSRFIGTAEIDTLPFIAKYGRMKLIIKEVASVTLGEDRETTKVAMKNGDNLQGVLDIGDLKLRTLLGEISVPIRHVSRIAVAAGLIRRGLVLYYAFDEKGQIARDLSGKANHGTLHGVKWTEDGRIGGGCQFDGRSTCIQRDHDEQSGLFPRNVPFSVAVWFRTSSPKPSDPAIVGAHYGGIGGGYHLKLDLRNPGGKAVWDVNRGAVFSKSRMNDGRWHHAVGIWDGAKTILYIDSVLQGSTAAPGSISYPGRSPLRIGHLHNAGRPGSDDSVYFFNGTIDEVMVFNRALPAKEVQLLWKSP